MKIAEAEFFPGQHQTQILVRLEGETEWDVLFKYFPDEISFSKEELIGKSVAEARALHMKKDVAYLRS